MGSSGKDQGKGKGKGKGKEVAFEDLFSGSDLDETNSNASETVQSPSSLKGKVKLSDLTFD